MSFSVAKRLRLIFLIVMICALILSMVFLKWIPIRVVSLVFAIVGFLSILTDLIMCIFFWKCPVCKHPLSHRHLFIRFCPYCGEFLEQ